MVAQGAFWVAGMGDAASDCTKNLDGDLRHGSPFCAYIRNGVRALTQCTSCAIFNLNGCIQISRLTGLSKGVVKRWMKE